MLRELNIGQKKQLKKSGEICCFAQLSLRVSCLRTNIRNRCLRFVPGLRENLSASSGLSLHLIGLWSVFRSSAHDVLISAGRYFAKVCVQIGMEKDMRKIAIASLALAAMLAASPAFSQVYFEYGVGPRYEYDRPLPRYRYPPAYAYDGYDGPRYRYGQRCWTERHYGYRHHHRVVVRQTVCD